MAGLPDRERPGLYHRATALAAATPVVVDRHGVTREIPERHRGDVFLQADQSDLLITDNQTQTYAAASPRQREVLSASAWGPWARPGTVNR